MDLTWKHYHKNGLLVEDLGFREAVKAFREQMLSVFDVAATHYGVGPIRCDEDLIDLYRSDYRFIWEQAHKMLQVLPVQNVGLRPMVSSFWLTASMSLTGRLRRSKSQILKI